MGNDAETRAPADTRSVVTVELVVEMPTLRLPTQPQQYAGAEVSERQGIRVPHVQPGPIGEDAWALPDAADAAGSGVPSDVGRAEVTRYRASVLLDERSEATLLRCQVLHAGTASDASGRRWNAAALPTEEALIAIVLELDATTSDREPTWRARVPIPSRAGFGRIRPGIHTIRLRLAANGELSAAEADD
jgi:hypothetical protein